jgi:hypothetical protein
LQLNTSNQPQPTDQPTHPNCDRNQPTKRPTNRPIQIDQGMRDEMDEAEREKAAYLAAKAAATVKAA